MTSIVEVYRRWPTKDDCIAHMEAVRWGESPTCPYCGADRVSHNRDRSRGLTASRWKCQRCMRSFSVTVGTIFHNSHIDLQRWFLLIGLMLSAKKGLSAMQAARDLDMRRPTVWSMMHRVRKSLADKEGALLRGIVEMDETYVGGKPRRRNRRSDEPPGGQGATSKEPVVRQSMTVGNSAPPYTFGTKWCLWSSALAPQAAQVVAFGSAIRASSYARLVRGVGLFQQAGVPLDYPTNLLRVPPITAARRLNAPRC